MDITKLFQQAQVMQEQMQKSQSEFAKKDFIAEAGAGMVKVVMSGDGRMKRVEIDPQMHNSAENQAMLSDLIVQAHEIARKKAEEDSKENMTKMFGSDFGNLPPGFKMPF